MFKKESYYIVDTITDTYVIKSGKQYQSLPQGFSFEMKTRVGSNGPCTMAFDNIPATAIKVMDAHGFMRDPFPGEFPAEKICELTWDGTYWRLTNPTPLTGPSNIFELFDDFVGGTGAGNTSGTISTLLWSYAGGAGTAFTYDSRAAGIDAFGVGRLTKSSAGRTWFYPYHFALSGNSATKNIIANTPNLIFQTRLAISDPAVTKTFTFGFEEAINTSPVYGFSFRVTDAGNWQCQTVNASGTTTVDSGVAQSTAMTTFRIQVSNDRSSVLFYINNVLVATITDNIPTTGGIPHYSFTYGADSFYVDIDYFNLRIPVLR